MVMIPQQRKEMFPEPEASMSTLESEAALAAGVIGLRHEIKTLVASIKANQEENRKIDAMMELIKEEQEKNERCFAALTAMLTKSLNGKTDAQI